MKYISISKFVTVNDWWHPNYDGNKIKITLSYFPKYFRNEELTLLVATGNDDFSMCMYSQENKFDEYKIIYDNIIGDVNQEYFELLGFWID